MPFYELLEFWLVIITKLAHDVVDATRQMTFTYARIVNEVCYHASWLLQTEVWAEISLHLNMLQEQGKV